MCCSECKKYILMDVEYVEVQQWSNGGFACGLKEEGRPVFGCELELEESENCIEFVKE